MNRGEVIEATRGFIAGELGKDPAALAATTPLLSGGIITSFDLVALAAFLERRFGVAVPDSKVSREFLDTLDQIATLVLALSGEVDPGPVASSATTRDPTSRLFPSFERAPLAVLVAAFALLVVADRVVGAWLSNPEARAAVETSRSSLMEARRFGRKRINYTYEDYERALERHELGETPRGPDELRVIFQGDSGTYGSYFTAEEACPAVFERVAAAADPGVRVYNVSYFGQTLVKDAEMFTACRKYEPDLVVVSVCSVNLHRQLQVDYWLKPRTHIVYNRRLYRRFLEGLPAGAVRPELLELDALLADSERRHGLAFVRALEDLSAIARDGPLLRAEILSFLPKELGTLDAARARLIDPRTRRFMKDRDAAHFPRGVFVLDERAVALLEAIIDQAHAAGIEVAILEEPEPTARAWESFAARRVPWSADGWATYEGALLRVAREKNVALVDALDLLPAEEFLDSERHWTVEGNEKIGRLLAEKLAPVLAAIRAKRRR